MNSLEVGTNHVDCLNEGPGSNPGAGIPHLSSRRSFFNSGGLSGLESISGSPEISYHVVSTLRRAPTSLGFPSSNHSISNSCGLSVVAYHVPIASVGCRFATLPNSDLGSNPRGRIAGSLLPLCFVQGRQSLAKTLNWSTISAPVAQVGERTEKLSVMSIRSRRTSLNAGKTACKDQCSESANEYCGAVCSRTVLGSSPSRGFLQGIGNQCIRGLETPLRIPLERWYATSELLTGFVMGRHTNSLPALQSYSSVSEVAA